MTNFYVDISLNRVAQIIEARIGNVTTVERDALAGSLNSNHKGLIVYDTDVPSLFTWDGTQFSSPSAAVPGAMVFKGIVTSSTVAPSGFDIGYVYVWSGTAATLTWAGQTFSPDASVQHGDQIIYRGTDTWDIFQADLNPASESDAGYIQIATQGETNTGSNDTKAVTALKLNGYRTAKALAGTYFASGVATTASTPLTVIHNLNLQNKSAFTCSVKDSAGYEVMASIKSIDTNSIELMTMVSLTNLTITIIGF